MLATLLVCPVLEDRRDQLIKKLESHKLTINHPDVLFLEDEEKLGVEQTKKIREFLSIKPYQAKGRGVVVASSQNLTQDAQNSLLKTLEEPPGEAIILLGVDKEESLLPTILSRCQVVRSMKYEARNMEENKFFDEIERLQSASVEERFDFIEKLEEKEEFLKELVKFYRKQLKKGKNVEFTKKLLEAEKWQKANVNIRAILEYLMLEL